MNWRTLLGRRFRRDCQWVLVFAVLYAVAAAVVIANRPQFLRNDGVAYLDNAGRIAKGEFRALVNAHWSPCWPALLAAWFAVFPAGPTATHALAATLSLVLLAEFYLALAVKVDDRRVRAFWVAALAVAIFPTAVRSLTPDLLLATLVFPLAAIFYRAHQAGSLPLAAAAGLLAALAYLAKTFAFPWALGLAMAAAGYRYWTDRKIARVTVQITALYLATFLPLSLLWMAALRGEYGEWTIGMAGKFNLSTYVLGHHTEWDSGLVMPRAGQRHGWDDPARLTQQWHFPWDWTPVRHALVENVRGLAGIAWKNPVFLFALLCLWGLPSSRPAFASLAAWLAGLWALGYLLVLIEYRYLLPAIPLLSLAAAAGAERLWRNGKQARRTVLAVFGLGLLGVGARAATLDVVRQIREKDYDAMVLAAAAAIRADGAPGTIAADWMQESMLLAYHADRVSVNVLTPHSAVAVDEAARRFHIRYLLWKNVSEHHLRELKNWAPLWSAHGPPGRWVLLKRIGPPSES